MSYISRHSFLPFVIYRILLGGTIFALLAHGRHRRVTDRERASVRDGRDRPRAQAPSRGRHGSSRGPSRAVGATLGTLAAAAEVPLELLRDRLAARLGGVDGVARLLELRDVAGHVLVVGGERVDAGLPRLRLGLEVAARDAERR